MGKTMSSFLDEPVTKKESTDECSNKFICGTSSMQGWRESQEDAHNCILEYDKDAAFFAVYDGHGGAEVSEYCSLKLPEYIKNNDDYKNDKIEDALVNCFLSFDQIFKTTDFADELNKLRPPKESDDDDNNSVVEENFDNLYKEAAMPIEQVIEKYTIESLKMKKTNDQNCNETNADTSACCSSSASSSSSSTKASTSQISSPSETNSDGVSSSSESSQCTSNTETIENDTKNHVPDSSDMDKETTTTTTTTQNGNNDDKQNSEAIAKNDDNESKNGEILSKDKGKNVVKPEQTIRKSPRQKAAQIYKQFLENGSEEDDSDSDSDEGESFESVTIESSEDECVNTAIEVDGEDSSEEVQDEADEDEDEDDDDDDDEYDDDDLFHRYRAGYNSGCTAVVALLKGLELYVANIGDSRCIVCRNGEIIEMSFDHKPTDDPELERIKKAGGRVFDERVEGGLNLSRAFGDHSYKKNKQLSDREQMITALPDIKRLTLKPNEDEFMFLACDGIWNSMTTEECVDFIRTRLQEGREKLSQICEEMFDSCLATDPNYDSKGNDNMTAVLIKFKWNIPKRGPSSPSSHTESDAKRIKIDDNSIPQIDTTV